VWIISSDKDYFVEQGGKRFLNSFLSQEIAALNTPPTQVFCFENLVKGIRDFVEQTGVSAKALPTEEESREIEEEALQMKEDEKPELLPLGWLSSNSMEVASAIVYQQARRRHSSLHAMSNVQPFVPGMPPDEPRE
jgi:hypothetical protein